jgi:hypothetical protein
MNLGYLSKLPKDKLQKIVLTSIIGLIAVGGVVQFYVVKNWNGLQDAQSQIAKLNDQIRQAERKARDARLDVAHRAEVRSFVETQQASMVTGDPFAWVVREMSLLAQQEQVRVTALHPGGKAEASGNSKTPTYAMRLDLSGSYDEIGTFVRDLENKFPTAQVQSLAIAGKADDNSQHDATVDVTLRMRPAEPSRTTEAKKKA